MDGSIYLVLAPLALVVFNSILSHPLYFGSPRLFILTKPSPFLEEIIVGVFVIFWCLGCFELFNTALPPEQIHTIINCLNQLSLLE